LTLEEIQEEFLTLEDVQEDFLTVEDGTDTLSRNVGKELPLIAA
jgi:hypothetical protein